MSKWGEDQRKESEITCSLVGHPTVFIEMRARQKITLLMEEYISKEWIGYLLGYQSEAGNYFVEDISIPPHKEALYASAEAEPFHIPKEKCIGVMHSHHQMSAFHSGTDQTHVDKNFDVSITVARDRESGALKFDTISVTQTPCGKEIRLNCETKYVQPVPDFDVEKWLNASKKNIEKADKKTTITYCGYNGIQSGYWLNGKFVPLNPNQEYKGYYDPSKQKKEEKKEETVLPETEIKPTASQSSGEEPQPGRIVTHKMVRKARQAIQDTQGIVLTRSEIEDALQRVPYAYIGGEVDEQEA